MIVKVCGLCVADNIREIRKLDVDWVGLIFCPSSQALKPAPIVYW